MADSFFTSFEASWFVGGDIFGIIFLSFYSTVFFGRDKECIPRKRREKHNNLQREKKKTSRYPFSNKKKKKKTNAEKQIPRKRRRKEDIVDVRPSEIQWCYSEWGTSRVPSILPLNCFVFSSFSAVEATILYKMPVLTKVLIPFDKTRENRACTA